MFLLGQAITQLIGTLKVYFSDRQKHLCEDLLPKQLYS